MRKNNLPAMDSRWRRTKRQFFLCDASGSDSYCFRLILIATVYHKNRFFILYFPRRIDKSSLLTQICSSLSCRFSGIIRCSGVARSSCFTVSTPPIHPAFPIVSGIVSGIDKFLIVVRHCPEPESSWRSAAFGSSVAVPLINPFFLAGKIGLEICAAPPAWNTFLYEGLPPR